jgi:hypothetical protein
MARTIQSPGVQISEVDLSLRAPGVPPTTVFIPGFAAKGPSSEPLTVSSLSEFEQIFGTPTNAAERYFYQSTKAVFQSPANVVVYRLPYGIGAGLDTSSQYSALVYPVASYVNSASSTNLAFTSGAYFFGKPTHIKLTETQYLGILRGTSFTWSASSAAAGVSTPVTNFNSLASLGNAGVIILNKSQAAINNRFEGTYVGLVDNTNLNPATPFDDFGSVQTITSTATAIGGVGAGVTYTTVPTTRLNFPLSATPNGLNGSISEVVELIADGVIATPQYNDTVTLGVFKLRQSVFSPDTIALDYVLQEGFVASFDAFRQSQNVNGGPAQSFFIENVDNNSKNVQTLVNPYISQKNTTGWLDATGNPQKSVRFLSAPRQYPLPNVDTSDALFTTRVGCPSAQYANFLTALGQTSDIVALGDFLVQDLTVKTIGDVPSKLTTMFSYIENAEVYPLSITCEAGLGTVYANSLNPSTSGYFDDTVPYTAVNGLTAQSFTSQPQVAQDYNSVAQGFVNFAANVRKDHLFIADPLTNIFVTGQNVKTLDDPNNTFAGNIYWPLRNQFSTFNTSYAAIYANTVKVHDDASAQDVWVPFSGFAAGIMANTDANFQPWSAPAGFTRGQITGVLDLGFYPKQKERDQLYKISLNPVVFFPNEGFVVYGQKTAQKKPSAFDRINVRRLFLTLENQTNTLARYFVFEPNTLFTRTSLKNVLTPIFDNAKNTQGLYDYLLICDERNNTPSVIDDNSLVVDIYIKPVRTAEYILVNFYATRTSTNFSEIVA